MNFESSRGMLPPGGQGTKQVPGKPAGTYTTSFDLQGTYAYLMPYIEQAQAGAMINFSYAYNDNRTPMNQIAASTQVPSWICPTNGLILDDPQGHGPQGQPYGQADYAPTVGTSIDPNTGLSNQAYQMPGALFAGGSYMQQITDGTSQTIAMAEDNPVNHSTVLPGSVAGGADPVMQGSFNADQILTNPNTGQPANGRASNRWAEPDKSINISGPPNNSAASPKTYINNNSSPTGGPPDCLWAKQGDCGPNGEIFSLHPGGAHVLMCDGSATFLAEGIDFRTLRCMLTRDEGVPVPSY